MLNGKDDYLKLYEVVVSEEQHFLEAHQTRVKFYTSVISVLLAATVAGIVKSAVWYHYLFISVGPILTYLVSNIAVDGTFRLYQRFLESVTMRAKIEQVLGLTDNHEARQGDKKFYWSKEPIVPPRHLKARRDCISSEEFIKKYSKAGYHRSTFQLFRSFQILSAIMFFGVLLLAIHRLKCG